MLDASISMRWFGLWVYSMYPHLCFSTDMYSRVIFFSWLMLKPKSIQKARNFLKDVYEMYKEPKNQTHVLAFVKSTLHIIYGFMSVSPDTLLLLDERIFDYTFAGNSRVSNDYFMIVLRSWGKKCISQSTSVFLVNIEVLPSWSNYHPGGVQHSRSSARWMIWVQSSMFEFF